MTNLAHEPLVLPTQPMSVNERDALLLEWKNLREKLTIVKDAEAKIRQRIIDESGLFDPDKQSGTQSVAIGNGWKVKAVKKINYKVDNKDGEAFQKLQELAAMGEVSAFKAKHLFRFDANLSVSKYKELDDAEKRLIDEIVTTRPGLPTLELVPPKSDV